MPENRYAPFKRRLEEERARLQSELGRLREVEQQNADADRTDLKGYGNHLADNASTVAEQEIDQAMERNLRLLLDEVERALAKYEDGTYGQCDNCGQEIAYERLERFPQAALCVPCRSEREKQVARGIRATA